MREVYAGLDVSDKQTHICLVDGAGAALWRENGASIPFPSSPVVPLVPFER